jgi:O-acetylserine/cysteine efflux transporter
MIMLALLIDGPHEVMASFHRLNWQSMFSIIFIVYGATWSGYGIWSWLLRHYTVSKVVPFTLLIPIFGILSSALILGEPLQSWKILAGMLVIGGLGVNLLGAQLFTRK